MHRWIEVETAEVGIISASGRAEGRETRRTLWPSEDLLWRWLPFLSRRVSSRFGMLAFILCGGCSEADTVAGSGCSAEYW